MANRPDFLDEIVDERSERNPEFPDLVEAAVRRRQLLRELAARREKLGLSQTVVAARMGTSQSAVARLEAGEIDAKLSTVERFAAALGQKVEWRDGAPQNQSANGCLSVICTLVSTSRSKTPSSSSVDRASVAAERHAIPGRWSSKPAWPTGWHVACRTGRPFR
jgi:transcriptional regulator with XRE-family HTH domain